MNKEIWKDIEDYEGYYQVSNHGNVRSLDRIIHYKNGGKRFWPGIIRKSPLNTHGYKSLHLSKDGEVSNPISVHRLVLRAFVPNPKTKPCCNHKDLNKTNNHVGNLEWVTYKENTTHATENGVGSCIPGEKAVRAKLSDKQAIKIRKMYKTGNYTQKKLELIYGVTRGTIYHIVKGGTFRNLLSLAEKETLDSKVFEGNQGELSPMAKVSNSQAIEIRKLYAKGGYSQTSIGIMFGVTQTAISHIVIGKSFKHLIKNKE